MDNIIQREVMPGLVSGTEVLGTVVEGVQLPNDLTVGCTETYGMDTPMCMVQKQKSVPIILMTPDKKHVSIYLTAVTDLSSSSYINALSLLLDNLSSATQSVNMFLGSCVSNNYTVGISAILASMESCKTPITTYAYGMCSVPETMIWCYGHERVIGEYGCISFGGGEWIKAMEKVYTPYIHTYMKKCRDIGILSEEDVTDITSKLKEIMFVFDPISKSLTKV